MTLAERLYSRMLELDGTLEGAVGNPFGSFGSDDSPVAGELADRALELAALFDRHQTAFARQQQAAAPPLPEPRGPR